MPSTNDLEIIHHPLYDTLLRRDDGPVSGIDRLGASTPLFGKSRVGDLGYTNMQAAGLLASGQVYSVKMMSLFMMFEGPKAAEMYRGVISQLVLTLQVGDKAYMSAPAWKFPAGGGLHGHEMVSNGLPGQSEPLMFGDDVVIDANQHFHVKCEFFPIGQANILDVINDPPKGSRMVIQVLLDGLIERKAQ